MRYAIIQHAQSGERFAVTAPTLDADTTDIRLCGPLTDDETTADLLDYNYDDEAGNDWDWDEWRILRRDDAARLP